MWLKFIFDREKNIVGQSENADQDMWTEKAVKAGFYRAFILSGYYSDYNSVNSWVYFETSKMSMLY